MPFKNMKYAFFSLKAYFVLDTFKFLYFHFILPFIVTFEEVNGEMIGTGN